MTEEILKGGNVLLKARKRWISLLLTLAMLVAFCVPFAGVASASATYTVGVVPSVSNGTNSYLNNAGLISSVTVNLDSAGVTSASGNDLFVEAPSTPSGYAFGTAIATPAQVNGTDNAFSTGVGVSYSVYDINTGAFIATVGTGVISLPATAAIQGNVTGNTHRGYRIHINGTLGAGNPGQFIIGVYDINVPGGEKGNVNLTVSAPASSPFGPGGTVAIASAGSGTVAVTAESIESGSSGGINLGVIDIKESAPGSLDDTNSSVKLYLPHGFTWDDVGASDVALQWGAFKTMPTIAVDTSDARILKLEIPVGDKSTGNTGAFIKLSGLKAVVDESVAKTGDMTCTLGGDSSFSTSDFTIGHYGDYGVTITALSAPTIVAGQEGVKTGEVEIDENTAGSIIAGRTVTLTLPGNVKWMDSNSMDPTEDNNLSNDEGLNVSYDAVGSSGNMLKLTFKGDLTTTAAKIVVKELKVTTPMDFTGDITATLDGSLGATGTITLAKAVAPVTATVSASNDVSLGATEQAAGDVTITENVAGNFATTIYPVIQNSTDGRVQDSGFLSNWGASGKAGVKLVLPSGVSFSELPTVAVTSGDLQIDTGSIQKGTDSNNAGFVEFQVKSSSDTASTISVSNIKLTVDRTVPVGPITLKVKGSSLDETHPYTSAFVIDTTKTDAFPNSDTAAELAIANCVTGLNDQNTGTAVFKIGDVNYTLNGKTVTSDVAPYIQNGRTMLPVRAIANAVGVTDSNILWDAAAQKVVVMKGDRVISMVIGSGTMYINGTAVTLDAAPQITSGRTMLPLRSLATALGCQIDWDGTAQTVTVNF